METTESGTVLTVAGLEELTAANADQFRNQVCAALDGHTVVEIDLSRTKTMDCAGLGALIAVRHLTCCRNGGVRLLGLTQAVQRLFDVVRAGCLFDIVNVEAPENPSLGRSSASLPLSLPSFPVPQSAIAV